MPRENARFSGEMSGFLLFGMIYAYNVFPIKGTKPLFQEGF